MIEIIKDVLIIQNFDVMEKKKTIVPTCLISIRFYPERYPFVKLFLYVKKIDNVKLNNIYCTGMIIYKINVYKYKPMYSLSSSICKRIIT